MSGWNKPSVKAIYVRPFTLPETNIAMENPPFWWYHLPGKMGIFMGYVSLPEGIGVISYNSHL